MGHFRSGSYISFRWLATAITWLPTTITCWATSLGGKNVLRPLTKKDPGLNRPLCRELPERNLPSIPRQHPLTPATSAISTSRHRLDCPATRGYIGVVWTSHNPQWSWSPPKTKDKRDHDDLVLCIWDQTELVSFVDYSRLNASFRVWHNPRDKLGLILMKFKLQCWLEEELYISSALWFKPVTDKAQHVWCNDYCHWQGTTCLVQWLL